MQFKILFLIVAVFSAANADFGDSCTSTSTTEANTACSGADVEHPVCIEDKCVCVHDSCSVYTTTPSCSDTGECAAEGATQMIAGLAALFALLTLY